MASTNKTPNYNLSQFTPTDKHTSSDWNSDMTKIDTAIKTNATKIGLLRSGSVAASTTANQVTSAFVPFGVTYPVAPHVVADVSTANPHRFIVSASSITTTGFTYSLWSDYTGSVYVTWLAVPK